jgi:hypothetical protein
MAIFPNMVGAVWRGRITIPNNTGTGSRLLDLLRAAGYPGPDACAVKVAAKLSDGTTDRPAFTAATPRANGAAIATADFTTHGQPVAAGVEYAEPSDADGSTTFVRSLSGSTIAAQCVVCW